MTNTNKTPRTKKLTLRTRQARCSHPRTIEISTARVCTECEAVLPLAAVA